MNGSLIKAFVWAMGLEVATLLLGLIAKEPVILMFLQFPSGLFVGNFASDESALALAALIQVVFWTLVIWPLTAAGSRLPVLQKQRIKGGPIVLGVLFLIILIAVRWPPEFVERRQRRAIVEQRLERFGGLSGLHAECQTLMSNQVPLFWRRSSTNDLPSVFAVLRPMEVEYHPELLTLESPNLRAQVVRIKLFGSHSTGGRSSPYYGLEIVHGPDAGKYRPAKKNAVSGNGHQHHRLISEGIYEVY